MKANAPRKVAVVGLGYVGLPLAIELAAKAGASSRFQIPVLGFDINPKRTDQLKDGIDVNGEIEADRITGLLASRALRFSTRPEDLKEYDFIIIAVPTPIDAAKSPNLEPLLSASRIVGQNLSKGSIVVFESTVYPGVTEVECLPVLERESGLVAKRDFFLGYSPERVNPGDREHTVDKITKVVSAQDESSLEVIAGVYGEIITAGVYRAGSIQVAEAAKVIENIQRDLNIALMNELSIVFDKLGLDTLEVLEAAKTKWNFLPFRPGLVGGHCIGVDPYYLTFRAELAGYHPQVILAGRRINDSMGSHVASRLIKSLVVSGHGLENATVTVLGFTFKENIPDVRNSRVIDVVRELESYSLKVQVYDPLADKAEVKRKYGIELVSWEELEPAKAIVLAVAHREFQEGRWGKIAPLLEHGRGVVADLKGILPRECPPGIQAWRL